MLTIPLLTDIFRSFFGTTDPFGMDDAEEQPRAPFMGAGNSFFSGIPAFHPGSGFSPASRFQAQRPKWGQFNARTAKVPAAAGGPGAAGFGFGFGPSSGAPKGSFKTTIDSETGKQTVEIDSDEDEQLGTKRSAKGPSPRRDNPKGVKRPRYDSPRPERTTDLPDALKGRAGARSAEDETSRSRSVSPGLDGRLGAVEERVRTPSKSPASGTPPSAASPSGLAGRAGVSEERVSPNALAGYSTTRRSPSPVGMELDAEGAAKPALSKPPSPAKPAKVDTTPPKAPTLVVDLITPVEQAATPAPTPAPPKTPARAPVAAAAAASATPNKAAATPLKTGPTPKPVQQVDEPIPSPAKPAVASPAPAPVQAAAAPSPAPPTGLENEPSMLEPWSDDVSAIGPGIIDAVDEAAIDMAPLPEDQPQQQEEEQQGERPEAWSEDVSRILEQSLSEQASRVLHEDSGSERLEFHSPASSPGPVTNEPLLSNVDNVVEEQEQEREETPVPEYVDAVEPIVEEPVAPAVDEVNKADEDVEMDVQEEEEAVVVPEQEREVVAADPVVEKLEPAQEPEKSKVEADQSLEQEPQPVKVAEEMDIAEEVPAVEVPVEAPVQIDEAAEAPEPEEAPVEEPEKPVKRSQSRKKAAEPEVEVAEEQKSTARRGRSIKRAEPESSQVAEETTTAKAPAKRGRSTKKAETEQEVVPAESAEELEEEPAKPVRRGRAKKEAEASQPVEEEPAPKGRKGRTTKVATPAPEETEEVSAAEDPAPKGRKGRAAKAVTPAPETQPEEAEDAAPRGRKGRSTKAVTPAPEPESEKEEMEPIEDPTFAAPAKKATARGRKGRGASVEPSQEPVEEEAPAKPVAAKGRRKAAAAVAAEEEAQTSQEELDEEPAEAKATTTTRGRKSTRAALTPKEEGSPSLAPTKATRGKKAASVEPMQIDDDSQLAEPTTKSSRSKRGKTPAPAEQENLSPAAAAVPDGAKVDLVLSDIHMGTHLNVSPSSTDFVETRYTVAALNTSGQQPTELVIRHRLATPLGQVGLQVWGGALVLADLLLAEPAMVQGKGVLELGCGTGIVGIVASRWCGAGKVLLSDKGGDGILELAEGNAAANRGPSAVSLAGKKKTGNKGKALSSSSAEAATNEIVVRQLDWFDDSAPLYSLDLDEETDGPLPKRPAPDPRFDWTADDITWFNDECTALLAADVVYDDFATQMLITRLKTLLQPTNKRRPRTLYLAMEKRPNFSLTAGKETVRAWEELQSAIGNANEELAKHGLPGRPEEKRYRLKMEQILLDEKRVPKRFTYERTARMEIWKVTLAAR